MIIWNPWHGCHKISEGCEHCYMYFLDRKRGIDTAKVFKTGNFDMPLQRKRDGSYKYPSGMEMYVGLSTDFFVEEADVWRDEAWRIIKARPDMVFRLLTKADERLPILLELPAKHKGFMAAPLIGPIEVSCYLATGQIEDVLCGGENYDGARPCHYEWAKSLSEQCKKYQVSFNFIETGTCFVKDGKTYMIHDKQVQSKQAFLSGLSHPGKPIHYNLHLPQGNLFGDVITKPKSLFREHCNICGSRMTCNGCSNCGACEHS